MKPIEERFFGVVAACLLTLAGCSSKPDASRSLQADGHLTEECRSCDPYSCDSENTCFESCDGDWHCGPTAFCDVGTHVCEPAFEGECGLYAHDGDGACYGDCRRDEMCAEQAFCFESSVCMRDLCRNSPLNDGNFCTEDACDRRTGVVTHENYPAFVSCADETFCNGSEMCDGNGHCTAEPVLCGHYVCRETGCPTTCAVHSDCIATYYCKMSTSTCEARVGANQACSSDPQCLAGTCVDGGCCDASSGVDPLAAVSINANVPTDFVTQVAPLYTGASPSQWLSSPDAINSKQVAVIRGQVVTETGAMGVPCAKVSVVGSPSLGSTRTRSDGSYSIAVNGGGPVIIRVELSGYIAADRQIDTKWHTYAIAPEIRLSPFGAATSVATDAFGATLAPTLVSGDSETDAQGPRTARILFPTGTKATVQGETEARTDFDIQVKEVTNMAKTGRAGMVASLPMASAFTYAVNLSLKGAENKTVDLSRPVPVYVDNFLGIPIGETVPVGYYDTNSGQWVASENGRVIKIVGKDSLTGEAQLDLNATAGAESNTSPEMLALGITSTERLLLGASPYSIGMSLWRFTTTHFSTWDCNWGWGPPGPMPDNPPPTPRDPGCGGSSAVGSIIDCEKQGLREKLPLAGTPFELFYSSVRQPGGLKPLHIPVTGATLPTGLKRVQLDIYIAGRKFTQTFSPPVANQGYDFFWDGLDATGRRLYGAQPIATQIGFTYDGYYLQTARFGANGGGTTVALANGRFDATLYQEWTGTMQRWEAQQSGLGGWDIDVHHGYDPANGTLHLGDGRDELVSPALNVFRAIPTSATLAGNGIAVAADGSVYFTDSDHYQIRKISLSGTITVVAGTGTTPVPGLGDGGPATSASLASPGGIAIGPDQRLYIADRNNSRVRVVDLSSGIINTFAGASLSSPDVDGPATTVRVQPQSVAVGSDGTVYIAQQRPSRSILRVRDGQLTHFATSAFGSTGIAVANDGTVYFNDNQRVRKVDPNGGTSFVTLSAQGSCLFGNGVGFPASSACIGLAPTAVLTVGPDGLLYMVDADRYQVLRISSTGVIELVAGTGVSGNGPAERTGPQTAFTSPAGLAFAPDGTAYILDNGVSKIYASRPAFGQQFPATVPSADGQHLYVFDSSQHHVKTLDARTGILQYAFRYDSAGYLSGIADRALDDSMRHETTITRSATQIKITAPFGQKTTLGIAADQLMITQVTDPELGTYQMDYYGNTGLLHHFSDPKLVAAGDTPYSFEFVNGLLTKDTDPLEHSQMLSASPILNGQRVTRLDQLNRPTTYDTSRPDPLTVVSTVAGPDLLPTVSLSFLDGRKADVAPDGGLFSGHQSSPDKSTVYSQIVADPILGPRAPVVSSTFEFMGGASDPRKLTTRSRSTVLSNLFDPTSVQTYTETQTVNGRAQPDKLFYDAVTRTFTTTSSAGRTTTRVIDAFGRTTSFKIGTLTATEFTYDDSATMTGKVSAEDRNDGTIELKKSFTYYSAGSGKMAGYLSGVSFARNAAIKQSSSYSTDAFGRVTLDTTGGDTANFGWDENGNLETVVPPGAPEHVQTFSALNQLSEYKPPALLPLTPPISVKTSYSYTADRKLKTTTTPDNVLTTHSYDVDNGRLTGITFPGGSSHFDYFSAAETAAGQAPGKIKAITGPYGSNLAFTYLGRLTTSSIWSGAVSGKVAWAYDNDFARISETITDAAGTSAAIKFGYNDLDKFLTCASLNTCSPPSTDALEIVHNGNGLLSDVNYGTLTEAYTYDNFGQLASKTAKLGTTPLLQSVYDASTWSVANRRDALGRIVHREEKVESASTATTFDYSYSPEGRLTDVLVNGALSEHYAYGAQNGNRITGNTPQRTVPSAQIVYDTQDRLVTYGTYTYTYTNNGELKTKTDTTTSQIKTYTYDAFGNLLSVATQGGATISYVIDGKNRRVAKKTTTGSTTTMVRQWLYRDNLKPVAELDGTGNLISTFVYASNQNTPDFMVRDGKTYRILTDHIGSPQLVVNVTNASDVPFRATYTAFGEAAIVGIADFLPFGFAGGLLDVDTGLVRFGARDYDPVVGRWISKDPIRFGGGQANLYVYVNNDPVNASDSSGLGPVEVARCLESGYSISECLNSERQLACRNWGILCDGDQPSPDASIFPPKPANDNGADGPDLRDCRGNLYKCLENTRMPPNMCPVFGPEKDCGACYRACNKKGGTWPFDKCPP